MNQRSSHVDFLEKFGTNLGGKGTPSPLFTDALGYGGTPCKTVDQALTLWHRACSV